MAAADELLERGIPQLTPTDDLDGQLAAEIDFLAGRTDRWTADSTPPSVRARAWVLLGDADEASAAIAEVVVHEATLAELVATAWSAARVGPRSTIDELLTAFGAHPDSFLVDQIPLGPRSTVVGMLLGATGRLGDAADTLRRAVVEGDARAPLWGALARSELARVLRCAAAVGPGAGLDGTPTELAAEYGRVLRAARTFFVAGSHRHLADRLAAIDDPSIDMAAPGGIAAPAAGRLRSGSSWSVGFGLEPAVAVRRSKGLVALRHLLDHSDRGVSAVELDRVVNGGDAAEIAALSRGDVLDGLGAGEGLADELRRLLFVDADRSRMTKLLRRTIAKLAESHHLLGAHLDASIETGYGCRYRPAGQIRPSWQL